MTGQSASARPRHPFTEGAIGVRRRPVTGRSDDVDDALGHRAGAAVSRRSLLGGAAALTGAAVILGAPHDPGDAALLADDPHIHLVDRRRGYVRNTVTPREWRADFRVVGTVSNRGAPASTAASVVVPDGGGGLLA